MSLSLERVLLAFLNYKTYFNQGIRIHPYMVLFSVKRATFFYPTTTI